MAGLYGQLESTFYDFSELAYTTWRHKNHLYFHNGTGKRSDLNPGLDFFFDSQLCVYKHGLCWLVYSTLFAIQQNSGN